MEHIMLETAIHAAVVFVLAMLVVWRTARVGVENIALLVASASIVIGGLSFFTWILLTSEGF